MHLVLQIYNLLLCGLECLTCKEVKLNFITLYLLVKQGDSLPVQKRGKGCQPDQNNDEQAITESALNELVGAVPVYNLEVKSTSLPYLNQMNFIIVKDILVYYFCFNASYLYIV